MRNCNLESDVTIRPMALSDAKVLMEMNNDEKISKLVVGNPKKVSIDEQLRWMENACKEKNVVRLIIEYRKQAVGTVIINHIDAINNVANINIKILTQMQGKGIGTFALQLGCCYAFENLNLYLLTAHILEENIGSRRVFEKIGFCKEGVLRGRIIKEGKRRNLVSYSCTIENLR